MTAKVALTGSEPPTGRSRHTSGYTLVESLVALIIVSLITMCVATGVSMAQRQFTLSMASSESKVLYSTLENLIRNEIAYADIVTYEGGDVWFSSLNYANEGGDNPTWKLVAVDEHGVSSDGRGEIALCREGTDGQPVLERLLASTAYTRGMTASVSTSVSGGTGGKPTLAVVSLSIYDGTGLELISEDFSVRPQNTEVVVSD